MSTSLFSSLFGPAQETSQKLSDSKKQPEKLRGFQWDKIQDKKTSIHGQGAPRMWMLTGIDPRDLLGIASLNDKLAANYCKVKLWTEAIDANKISLDMKAEIARAMTNDKRTAVINHKGLGASLMQHNMQVAGILEKEEFYDQAQDHYVQILKIFEKENLEKDDIAYVYTKLGSVSTKNDEYEKALMYYGSALEIYKTLHKIEIAEIYKRYNLGKDERLASVYLQLGSVSTIRDEFDQALMYYGLALEIYAKLGRSEDVDIADVYEGMGTVYRYQENSEECLKYLNKALEIRVKAFGSEDLSVARLYDIYVRYYIDILENKKAKEYCDMSLKIKLSKDQECSAVELAECYLGLGLIYIDGSEHEKAANYLNMGIELYTKEQLQDHPKVIKFYNALAYIQEEQKRYSEALGSICKAEDIVKNTLGLRHHLLADSYYYRGFVYYEQKKIPESKSSFKKCLEIRLKVFGDQHQSVAQTYLSLGLCYFNLESWNQALEYYQLYIDLKIKKIGEYHSSLASIYNKIATAHDKLGNTRKSIENLAKSLEIKEKNYGKDNLENVRSKYNIGIAYQSLKDYRLAITFLSEALDIYIKVGGMHHPDVAKTMKQLAENYEYIKNSKEASRLQKVLAMIKERRSTKNMNITRRNIGISYEIRAEKNKYKFDMMNI